jgi:hypothetical protein
MRNRNRFIHLYSSLLLLFALVATSLTDAQAAAYLQVGVVTPTPENADTAPVLPAVSFTQMGQQAPLLLQGPADSVTIPFNLAWNQQPEGMAKLELQISAYFSSLVAAESASTISGLVAGDFSAALNGVSIGVKTLQMSGINRCF